MAITVDATGTAQTAASGTTASYTGLTTTAAADGIALIVCFQASTAPTSVTATWDSVGANQSFFRAGSVSGGGAGNEVVLFGLIAPTSFGNKTISVSWTNTAVANVEAVSLIGCLQNLTSSNTFKNFNSSNVAATAQSLNCTITSPNTGMVISGICGGSGAFSAPNGTQLANSTNFASTVSGASSRNASPASSPLAVTWTAASGAIASAFAVMEIQAAPPTSGWETPYLPIQPAAALRVARRAYGAIRQHIGFAFYPPFNPAGWEIQPPLPPYPTPNKRFGAAAPLSNVEAVFVPTITTPTLVENPLFQPPALRYQQRSAAFVNGDDATGEDDGVFVNWQNFGFEPLLHQPQHIRPRDVLLPPSNVEYQFVSWRNVGFEPLLHQPQHIRPRDVLLPPSNVEYQFVNWRNTGWEIQPHQPQHPRPEKWGSIEPFSNIETTFTNWYNAGFELQPYQPQHIRPRDVLLPPSNIEYVLQPFYPAGWELQSYQPQHIRYEKWGALAPLSNVESVFVPPPPSTAPAGWEIQPHQPQHPRPEKWASIEPFSNIEYVFTRWQNAGWEVQPYQPQHIRPRDVLLPPANVEYQFVNWRNVGWEIQSVQPPRQRWELRAGGIRHTTSIPSFANWQNAGWEIQSYQPQHIKIEQRAAIMPLSNIEAVFVGPVVTTPTLVENQVPQPPRQKWELRTAATYHDSQFAIFVMQPWTEIQTVQPSHPRPERAGSIVRGDDGIENTLQVQFVTSGWGFDGTYPQPPRRRWEVRAGGIRHVTSIPSLPSWLNFGFETQPPQPPHLRPERAGSITRGDDGIQNVFTGVIVTYNSGFDGIYPQPPRQRWELRGAAVAGKSQFPIFANWQNAGWEIQSVPPPRQRWELRAGGIRHTTSIPAFANWFNAGWEIQSYQPQHIAREKRFGSQSPLSNVEFVFTPPPPLVAMWQVEFSIVRHPRGEKFGSIIESANVVFLGPSVTPTITANIDRRFIANIGTFMGSRI